MSDHDIAVSVRRLSKAYTIAHNDERHVTLAEQILHRLRNPFQRAQTETFWALKDVEFDIKKGDVVGIIGRNGAGKSTLLKILSRITEPTAGEIRLYGRVGSLLEVGTGFHPELTGRENVYLNGQILGMRKREIDKQFDAIVDFAEVEKFLDTPVKRYSSGMYVRLAFAVAAHLRTEILIVDEVLAVGDAEFQKKCLGKMHDVAQGGRTVLFVSHNESAVKRLCTDAIILTRGGISYRGSPQEAFQRLRPKRASSFTDSGRTLTSGKAKLVDAQLMVGDLPASRITGSQTIRIALEYQVQKAILATPEFVIRDANSVQVIFGSPWYSHGKMFRAAEGVWRTRHEISLPMLAAGRYSIDILLVDPCVEFLDVVEEALEFTVDDSTSVATGFQYHQSIGRGCINVEVH